MLSDPSLLRTKALINGDWCDADDGATFAVTDPATGKPLATVPDLGATETARGIKATGTFFPRGIKATGTFFPFFPDKGDRHLFSLMHASRTC